MSQRLCSRLLYPLPLNSSLGLGYRLHNWHRINFASASGDRVNSVPKGLNSTGQDRVWPNQPHSKQFVLITPTIAATTRPAWLRRIIRLIEFGLITMMAKKINDDHSSQAWCCCC